MSYDLVAFAGPVEGERFVLESGGETPIGRGARGIHLPDPLVSVSHARILNEGGGWFLEDLGSATGTKLNGVSLKANVRAPVQVGDTIAIGESQFKIDSSGSRVLRRLMWAMVPAWALVFVAAAALFWISGERQVSLALGQAVRTPSGPSQTLIVPKAFIREHGLDVDGLALRRVTDFDGDGVDELWMYDGPDEIAITFTGGGPDGAGWGLLGRFPKGCVDRELDHFPDLTCNGLVYRALDDPRGIPRYRAVAQDEPVVWLFGEVKGVLPPPPAPEPVKGKRKSKAKAKAKAEGEGEVDENGEPKGPAGIKVPEAMALNGAKGPLPYRVSLGTPDDLAGFLAARGVVRGAHYVICEDAIPGLPAQAVLEGGEVVQLSQGCGQDLVLTGSSSKAFEGAKVAAVALTAAGREALVRHVAYTWSGDPGDLFLDASQRRFIGAMKEWPKELVGKMVLEWKAPPHFFAPFASEAVLPERVAMISEKHRPPDAITASLLSRGRAEVDPEGCARVVVRTHPFRCALLRGCPPGAPFLDVTQVGCDSEVVLVRTGYATGAWTGESEQVEVRVEIETSGSMAVRDVIRARVGVRPKLPDGFRSE